MLFMGRPFVVGLRKPFDVGAPLRIHAGPLVIALRRRSPPSHDYFIVRRKDADVFVGRHSETATIHPRIVFDLETISELLTRKAPHGSYLRRRQR
jgi:hypothetical protein